MAAWAAMNLNRGFLASALLVVLVTGCSTVVDGRAVIATPRLGAPVEWKTCRPSSEDVKLPEGVECGLLSVPVDYAKPDGDVARIAMVRIPATGQKIGSLVINPGGPGESGVDAALSTVDGLPKSVRDGFDLVGFDPRGVGLSTPALRCNSDQENDRERAEPPVELTPEGVAHLDSESKSFGQRCIDEMGEGFLANVGTMNVARDLDAIRAALGDDKLTYLGYSYGTQIGAAYAEQFPDKVRAMILDGVIDPNADPVERSVKQSVGFQTAFDDYAADCAKATTCPLGTDPTKAVDVFLDLLAPLAKNPAKTSDPRGLSRSDALTGTTQALYSPMFWQYLSKGLEELRAGNGNTLLRLADLYEGRDSDGHYSNATDVFGVVTCVDRAPITDNVMVELDRRTRQAAPFSSYGEFTGLVPRDGCSFLPRSAPMPQNFTFAGLPPTLVVSTTRDPATPYQAGVDLARQIGGSLLTAEGTQHTAVFLGNRCVDDIAAKYLTDIAVPPAGARC